MIRFRCHRNGADTGKFIDGKLYDAVRTEGNAFVLLDERGHARYERKLAKAASKAPASV